jgi:hypothetical protein
LRRFGVLPTTPSDWLDSQAGSQIGVDPNAGIGSPARKQQRHHSVVVDEAEFKILIVGRG